MRKSTRPRYPRINCSVPGCKRGTTIYEPGTSMICGRCWRRAPKEIRSFYGKFSRRAKALERRGDPRAEIFHRRMNGVWKKVLELLTYPETDTREIPALMAEQLRKDGLL